MDKYFEVITLLGLNNGNLPVHRGMREKRYQSIEKMLDLLDVVGRIGPKFPVKQLMIDPHDPEWDDDMTYLYVDYHRYRAYTYFSTVCTGIFLYNYNVFFHNKHMSFVTKSLLGILFIYSNTVYLKYRK